MDNSEIHFHILALTICYMIEVSLGQFSQW